MSTEKQPRTHWKKLFNNDYLGAWSLEEDQDKDVTITKTGTTLVKSGQNPKGEECPIVFFEEFDIPMVLNSTNCKTIESIYGPIVEDWVGKKVTLYVQGGIKAFGTITEALRIRKAQHITETLKAMFEAIKPTLGEDEIKKANRIISNEEKTSYTKLYNFLKSKDNEHNN